VRKIIYTLVCASWMVGCAPPMHKPSRSVTFPSYPATPGVQTLTDRSGTDDPSLTRDTSISNTAIGSEPAQLDGNPPPLPLEACSRPTQDRLSEEGEPREIGQNGGSPIEFEFRGCQLGDVVNEAVLAAQGYDCFANLPYDRACVKFRDKVGDAAVSTMFFIVDGRFASLQLTFPTLIFSEVVDSFSTQYGPPYATHQEEIQNQAGDTFTDTIVTWKTTNGDLEIKRYAGSFAEGSVWIRDPALGGMISEQQKQKKIEGAQDL